MSLDALDLRERLVYEDWLMISTVTGEIGGSVLGVMDLCEAENDGWCE